MREVKKVLTYILATIVIMTLLIYGYKSFIMISNFKSQNMMNVHAASSLYNKKWTGKAYITINKNKPSFTSKQKRDGKKSFIKYSNLDKKDRAGVAFASVSIDTINEDERAPISSIKPSGWQTIKYPDIVDENYVYNRCHLLMQKVAAGIKTDECNSYKNLVTGTRYMNVDGQLPFEMKILNYVYETKNHVLYRTTPIYKGKNLVCSGVQMEAYSVEDNGKGICFNIYCFNIQPGLTIDYKTGKVEESKKKTEDMLLAIKNGATSVVVPDEDSSNELKENKNGTKYILNTNSHKFHLPSCESCKDMATKNKKEGKYKRDDLIAAGYSPCGICKP